LNANETAMWYGRPQRGPFVLPGLISVPFGAIFLAFSVFWFWATNHAMAPSFLSLIGVLLVAAGIAIMIGPTTLQLLRYQNTYYMITDKRLIIQTGAIGEDTRFVDFDKIQETYVRISVFDKIFGTGTLYANTASSAGFYPSSYGGAGINALRPSLAAINEPYKVQKLLQEAIETAKKKD
jgi:uncharacterized membrane protein YdbT with pleckstrin-like domain